MGYEICSPASPILAVRLKDEATSVWVWNRRLENGVYVNLALPPGTPNGACLLRCSLSAAHTDEQIEEIQGHFAAIMDDLPLRTEGVAVAQAQEETVLGTELTNRYLLPWCKVAIKRLHADASQLLELPRRFAKVLPGTSNAVELMDVTADSPRTLDHRV